ncbi:AcrR family transcriptional regulator [Thermocatellispora tengchongensis]|uniref:AcrR family transcriptional regulator n=1 Tax=Thermocatellispora tengchongensis TaxID=1073253 RepID=A0A840PKP1_9ACTN|nr:TetR/AcrR family transcriptional regulator [Thermocatellispora tengchongensis]MBB5138493.1 AcrR family transcriptional regulator [Thermocatellispora tengchongensis]
MATGKRRTSTANGVRAPLQERSQRSFDRVLDTALELLAEKGYSGFTITEVSRRSGVSTGSIYTRVDGRDDLLRAAQERFNERMAVEHLALTDPQRWAGLPLAQLLPSLVKETAAMLERNGAVLGAFLQRGAIDPAVASAGKASYQDLYDRFTALLLTRGDEIRHPDPVRAAGSCFVTVYAVLARALALDVAAEAAEGSNLGTLVEDVAKMSLAFLLSPS